MMGNARTVTSEKDIGNREQGIVILLFFNHKVPKGKHKGPQRLIREICENSWNEKSPKHRDSETQRSTAIYFVTG